MSTVIDPLSMANLARPEVVRDPHPLYRRIRSEEPVRWDEPLQSWVLARYADVAAAQADLRFSCERRFVPASASEEEQALAAPVVRILSRIMAFLDPPDHTRLRGLVTRAFAPRTIEVMRPQVQRTVDELLDRAAERGQMDAIEDFAYPLPAIGLAQLLGVPPDDRDQFRKWSNDTVTSFVSSKPSPEMIARGVQAVTTLTEYVAGLIAKRRAHPESDLLTALATAEDGDDRLTKEEIIATSLVLLVAGHETTTLLIGNGLVALLQHPEQLLRLQRDPSLVPSAVEEFLRYGTPTQVTVRIAKEDLEIGGRRIARGQQVLGLPAAANRDPERFRDPDTFDVAREDNRHLAFGHGIHFCIGAALARMQVGSAFASLLERFPAIRLGVESGELDWFLRATVRGLRSLPVVLR